MEQDKTIVRIPYPLQSKKMSKDIFFVFIPVASLLAWQGIKQKKLAKQSSCVL